MATKTKRYIVQFLLQASRHWTRSGNDYKGKTLSFTTFRSKEAAEKAARYQERKSTCGLKYRVKEVCE